MKIKGYYFITDSTLSQAGNSSDVRKALAAGVSVVQYRDKKNDTRTMVEEALKLRKICRGVTLLINDRIDVALAAGADGVHIGQGDAQYKIARRLLGEKSIIGLTAHNVKEAKVAEALGADYIGVSPVFATSTKKDAGVPVGVEMVRSIRKHISIPIVAIGGIKLSNAKEVIGAGADAVCAISEVMTKPDVGKGILKFQQLFKQ